MPHSQSVHPNPDLHLLIQLHIKALQKCPGWQHSHVLHHDVLVRHQAVDAVVSPLPPVLRGPLVQQQRRPLLEGELAGWAPHVVELGDGFDGLTLCRREAWVRGSSAMQTRQRQCVSKHIIIYLCTQSSWSYKQNEHEEMLWIDSFLQ